jgi:hypothetical protein
VIYGVGFTGEKIPLGEATPYFEKLTQEVKINCSKTFSGLLRKS